MQHVHTHTVENNRGLTLVELLVALAMAAIVSVALVAIFSSYTRTQTVQENVISMQQNLRAALYLMERDLRMAGYRGPDPTNAPAAGFLTANADNLSFTVVDDATNTLETITYTFTNNTIQRSDGSMANTVVAENVDGLEFYYTLKNDLQNTTYSGGDLGNIRSVEITVLARTNRNDRDFTNTTTYTAASGATWGPFNDGRRRRISEGMILFRNM
jgi:type IV pilus assembly protein PilW